LLLFSFALKFLTEKEMPDSYPLNPVRAAELQPNRLLFMQDAHDPVRGWRLCFETSDHGIMRILFRQGSGPAQTLLTADPAAESLDARLLRLEEQVATLLRQG
jgi:hypothetical protein